MMTHDEAVTWWLKQAPTYFTDMEFFFTRPDLIDRFNLGLESRILELGFGYGRELSQFCRLSKRVVGLELSPVTCSLAEKNLIERSTPFMPFLSTYDGLHIPFADGSFDLIYSCFLLQHMSRENAKSLIREALRVTAVEGNVLMEFFGDPAFYHPTEDCFNGNPEDGTGMFNNAYTQADIEAMNNAKWVKEHRISTFSNFWGCFQP